MIFASSRRSAGRLSPDSSSSTSPGPRSRAGTVCQFPPRSTRAIGTDMPRKAAKACSAFASWRKPRTPLSSTMARIARTSAHSPSAGDDRGDDQNPNHQLAKLRQELLPRRQGRLFRQLVRPQPLQDVRGLLVTQPAFRVASQTLPRWIRPLHKVRHRTVYIRRRPPRRWPSGRRHPER